MSENKNFIKKFLDIFKPGVEDEIEKEQPVSVSEPQSTPQPTHRSTPSTNKVFTNKDFLNELSAVFCQKLEEMSLEDRMLYPMAFNIIMHESDYANVQDTLGAVLEVVVRKFERVIFEKKGTYPDYTPLAKDWVFQVTGSKMEEIPLGEDVVLQVKRGKLTVLASAYFKNANNSDNSNVDVEANVMVSMRIDNSNVYKDVSINPDAFKQINANANGMFTFPFGRTLADEIRKHNEEEKGGSITPPPPPPVSVSDGYATLSYQRGGNTYRYTMKDGLVYIVGKNSQRAGRNVFKIEEDDILDPHVQVKYIPDNGRFQIAAFGSVRLNSRRLEESNGGNFKWYDLANRSRIFINDSVSIDFEIKK